MRRAQRQLPTMTSHRRSILTLAAALALAAASACDEVPQDAVESCEELQPFAGHVSTDILFVVDDSLSMDPFQQRLRLGLSRFINTLVASPVANDFRIGVTTTSVADYDGGVYYPNSSPAPDGTPYPRGILTAIDPAVDPADTATWGWFLWDPSLGFYGARILDWSSATIVEDFERNVLVGDLGAWREQPLEAMRLALSEQIAAGRQNVGFLRPGSRLAIVFLSDEDDCSGPQDAGIQSNQGCRDARTSASSTLVPVSSYVSFLEGPIGGEVRDTVVAAIVGATCTGGVCDVNALCSGATTTPTRLAALLGAFDSPRTRLASICDDNFDSALDDFAQAIMSQTVPLEGAPADWRMLVATVSRGGETLSCAIVPFDAPAGDVNAADAVYTPPQEGRPATLTFQQGCKLEQGDTLDLKVVCAG
jgi:hypothetical protein